MAESRDRWWTLTLNGQERKVRVLSATIKVQLQDGRQETVDLAEVELLESPWILPNAAEQLGSSSS